MSTVAQIKKAIERLTTKEQLQVRDWMLQEQSLGGNDDILTPRASRQKVLDAIDRP
jgi:hypothetical protein